MNKIIWFIRHAESAANAGLATPSPITIPITEKGHKQAQFFAEYFIDEPSLIVISPFLRTQETAKPLINRYAKAKVETWDIQEFTYLSLSKCGISTFKQRKPLVEEYWVRNEVDYCDGDGAESFNDFINRIQKTIEDIKNSPHEKIAIFTHGLFIKTLMWLVLMKKEEIGNIEMKKIYNFMTSISFPNTACLKLNLKDSDFLLSPISTDHLSSDLFSY